jgi:hypothetical protein
VVKTREAFALALDPARILTAQGLTPDTWQRDFLRSRSRHILLCCSRGAGKSRATSALALHTALFRPGSQILLLSRAQRQALELFRYVKQGYRALGETLATVRDTTSLIELANGSRLVALPGREETIRSFQGVHLLVLDEAARIPDALYRSVRPMTGTVRGRTVCLSTPFGRRGFFWQAWTDEGGPWQRFRVPWQDCPRLGADFIAEERRQFGAAWVAQEYECDFTAHEGLVYPTFEACVPERWQPPATGRRVGGIDFGFRNPFAAVWGLLDREDVLWIEAERYLRATPLHEHATALPRGVLWFADPAGASDIAGLRAAGHVVRPGVNDIRPGIQAVTARLQTGRLKVRREGCPNLLAEARLYRYPAEGEGAREAENPLDAHNHALGALRYLVTQIDHAFLARLRSQAGRPDEPVPSPTGQRRWLRLDNEALWDHN